MTVLVASETHASSSPSMAATGKEAKLWKRRGRTFKDKVNPPCKLQHWNMDFLGISYGQRLPLRNLSKAPAIVDSSFDGSCPLR